MAKRKLPKTKKKSKDGIALIDMEVFAYHVCMENLSERYDPKLDEYYWYLPFEETVEELLVRIEQMVIESGCARCVGAKGGGSLFRKKIEPSYKQNRKGKKPLGYHAIFKRIEESIEVLSVEGLEADDVLGLMHTDPNKPDRTVICSNDKDMKTLPGFLYDPTCPDQGVIEISEDEADRNFAAQTLAGDTTDGYKGCPNIGMITAHRALAECKRGEEWDVVVGLFATKGLKEKDALVQARLARILRHGEVDENGKPILWSPPESISSPARKKTSKKKASGRGSSSGSTTKKTPSKKRAPSKKKVGHKPAKR